MRVRFADPAVVRVANARNEEFKLLILAGSRHCFDLFFFVLTLGVDGLFTVLVFLGFLVVNFFFQSGLEVLSQSDESLLSSN